MNKIKEFFGKFIKDKKDIYTIPNILVYFRFLLVIVFIVIYFLPISVKDILINHYICAGIDLLAGFTDFLDGQIARRFNMVTELGKAIDPLADKLMQFAIALCLLITYFHIWTFILMLTIFVIKEITLLIFDIVLFKKEKKLDGAKFFGKVSTFVFYVAMGFLLLLPSTVSFWSTAVYIATSVSSFFLLLSYILYFPVLIKLYRS